jgi:hypothetical protein
LSHLAPLATLQDVTSPTPAHLVNCCCERAYISEICACCLRSASPGPRRRRRAAARLVLAVWHRQQRGQPARAPGAAAAAAGAVRRRIKRSTIWRPLRPAEALLQLPALPYRVSRCSCCCCHAGTCKAFIFPAALALFLDILHVCFPGLPSRLCACHASVACSHLGPYLLIPC